MHYFQIPDRHFLILFTLQFENIDSFVQRNTFTAKRKLKRNPFLLMEVLYNSHDISQLFNSCTQNRYGANSLSFLLTPTSTNKPDNRQCSLQVKMNENNSSRSQSIQFLPTKRKAARWERERDISCTKLKLSFQSL